MAEMSWTDKYMLASKRHKSMRQSAGYTSTLKQTGKGPGHSGTAYGRQVSLGPLALEALTFLKDLSREAGGTNASKEGTPDRQINRIVHVSASFPSIFRKSNRYLLLIRQEGSDSEALCPYP